MNQIQRTLLPLALTLCCMGARADLVGLTPYATDLWGQQSDANTGSPYMQKVSAPSGFVVDLIRWWGYHGVNSLGASEDNFLVTLDGVVQAGTLSISTGANGVSEYTLNIADVALTSATLSVMNDSFDVEWYWQSAEAIGNPDAPSAGDVAYALIGDDGGGVQPVPEPSSLSLLLGVALGVLGIRRARAAR